MDERLIPAIKHVQGMVNDERPQEEVLGALEGVLKMAHGERLSEKRVEQECSHSPSGKHGAFHGGSGSKRSVCRWCEEYFDHPQEPNPLAGATELTVREEIERDSKIIEDTVSRGAYFQDWRLASLAAKKGHRGLMVTTAGDFVVMTDRQELALRAGATGEWISDAKQLMLEIEGNHNRTSHYGTCSCWSCVRIRDLLAAPPNAS